MSKLFGIPVVESDKVPSQREGSTGFLTWLRWRATKEQREDDIFCRPDEPYRFLSTKMPYVRWRVLQDCDSIELTPEEIEAGWHFCPEWDGLLVGPGLEELDSCLCKGEQDEDQSS